MAQPWVDDVTLPSTSNSPSSSLPVPSRLPSSPTTSRYSGSNVFQLLVWREISPRAKHSSKRLWGGASRWNLDSIGPKCEAVDAKRALISWVEAESLRHFSAKYCPLVPPPRSTIAAAFSPDGKTLASTHGDHTVKIIDSQTGRCMKVLSGHRRTPWVVRFHPMHPEILASGSLDHEVRLWDANTAECIGSRDFYRPIASIAFHAQGEHLAVASGHKLYIWHYSRRGETSSPNVVLKTRRSLRAVHFHPYAAPFLLTAEVNDLDSPDSPMTLATSKGYLHYSPALYFANVSSNARSTLEAKVPLVPFPCFFWPAFVRPHGRNSLAHDNRATSSSNGQLNADSSASAQMDLNMASQQECTVSPMDTSPVIPSTSNPVPEVTNDNCLLSEMEAAICESMDPMETTGAQQESTGIVERFGDANSIPPISNQSQGVSSRTSIQQSRLDLGSTSQPPNVSDLQMLLRSVEAGQLHKFLPFGDPACWDLPFLQGWLMGQTHAGLQPTLPANGMVSYENSLGIEGTGLNIQTSDFQVDARTAEAESVSSSVAGGVSQPRGIGGQSGFRHRSQSHMVGTARVIENTGSTSVGNDNSDRPPMVSRIESELATSLPAAAAELPCTVKLRIWPHDILEPCTSLDADTCRLTIPHAVLCSEMGAHFSPCGRFLAACVACVLPRMEADPGLHSQVHHGVTGVAAATSPTRHPISAHQVMYELRIYSLEESTFGSVLASRAIRAAHCLTSIQFSPTSEHVLLAYGRRHSSLLRSIVVDGETTIPVYTILEVYRISDMELVRVLPSAEDEVNVACFHPWVGGGLVYGTKEGKLRILQCDGSHRTDSTGPSISLEENMLEVQTYALEC